jgi:uroporphyrinogen III methyltransferase/synthase
MKKLSGKVYLIGAGPGDPGLITVKGRTLLKMADVVIYDHLVNPYLLDCARRGAKRIDVGKECGKKTLKQMEINKLLIREARKGRWVVRLKGGDPFVFGRGGEEVEALAGQGIPFEVVPGITSAIAAPAYAGIPLTHRDFSSSFAIVTGHEDPEKERSRVDLSKIAQSVDTLVCVMGVGKIDDIVRQVRESGRLLTTPVAIVEKGTYAHQRVIKGNLKDILFKIKKARVTPPAVIVVGEVVNLRERCSWFESLPLFGKTVVVTRAKENASLLIEQLEEAGAQVIPFPTIEITPPASFRLLDKKIACLHHYHFLVFTSVNGVESFFSRLKKLRKDLRCLHPIKIAALGEITAHALREHLIYPEIVPAVFTSTHLAKEFKREDMRGKRVLMVRSELSSGLLPYQLKKIGANVDEVHGYTVKIPKVDSEKVRRLFKNREIDLITFTSPSTFTHFVTLMKGNPLRELLRGVKIVAIGPVTKKEIEKQGIKVAITASPHTISGVVDAIISYYRTKKR